MLITKTTNTTSIRLTVHIEATDEVEDEALVYIEAVKEAYTREINTIEET